MGGEDRGGRGQGSWVEIVKIRLTSGFWGRLGVVPARCRGVGWGEVLGEKLSKRDFFLLTLTQY